MSSSESIPELTQAVNWLALGFRVPIDWEIVRHGVGFERGSLVFVDRVRQRLSVSWTACPRVPNLERLLSDFENQPLTMGETLLTQNDHFGFRVLECKKSSGEHVTHALRFDPASNRLIELELPGLAARDGQTLTHALLAEFSFSERDRDHSVRAFGVHAALPAGFGLRSSRVKPADVTLEFERPAAPGERSSASLKIRRSGMARAWFDGDAGRAIRARNPTLRFRDFARLTVGPHVATTARGFSRAALLTRALGMAVSHDVLFWECPEENAVFETELCVSRRGVGAEASRVWCCGTGPEEPKNGH
jgi:hypothetical protein